MDFELSDELAALQETCRRIAQDKVKPRAREIDETEEYPQDLFEVFRDAGMLGLCIPTEIGGGGAGILGLTIAIEEVAKYSNAAALMLLLTRLPTGPVMIAGSPEQNERYVAAIADGSKRAAFCLSEPQAGSDVMGMRTKAVADGDDWVLNGTKCWISGVAQADWYTVFAKTATDVTSRDHDSITAFIVERSLGRRGGGRARPQDGRARRRHGRAAAAATCGCPPTNVIGEVGGFRLAMLGLNSMRPIVAARGIGLAEGALMYATEYVKERAGVQPDDRRLPGHPVGDRQAGHRDRGGPAAHLPVGVAGRPGQVHQGVGAVPVDGEVLRHRAGGEGVERVACRCSARPAT